MFRAAVVLMMAAVARGQSAPPDAQALQALVAEIHQLRMDLQSTTVVTQRVQIVLYRVQTQTALATAATARLDSARSALAGAQAERKRVADILQMEEQAVATKQGAAERTRQEETVSQIKATLQRLAGEEQRLQSREIDADTANRAEQRKLADLQDQLDKLDRILDGLTRK